MESDFLAMLQILEPLNPELVPYLSETEQFPMLRHPLVYQVPYSPNFAAWSNAIYQQKQSRITELEAEGNFAGIISLYERPYRVAALMKYGSRMTDTEYWSSVGWAWSDTENVAECWDEWMVLMQSKRPSRSAMMTPDERKELAGMPEVLTVWRGQTRDEVVSDFSWTLSKDTALWFARRFGNKDGVVLKGTVAKSKVLAYIARRNESEIMAWPGSVQLQD